MCVCGATNEAENAELRVHTPRGRWCVCVFVCSDVLGCKQRLSERITKQSSVKTEENETC